MEIQRLNCCGIKEIIGFHSRESPRKRLLDICKKKYDTAKFGNTYFIFSVNKLQGIERGDSLAAYITRHKLGTVVNGPVSLNPNSENKIKVWLWRINQKNLHDWYTKQSTPQKQLNKLLKQAENYATHNPPIHN